MFLYFVTRICGEAGATGPPLVATLLPDTAGGGASRFLDATWVDCGRAIVAVRGRRCDGATPCCGATGPPLVVTLLPDTAGGVASRFLDATWVVCGRAIVAVGGRGCQRARPRECRSLVVGATSQNKGGATGPPLVVTLLPATAGGVASRFLDATWVVCGQTIVAVGGRGCQRARPRAGRSLVEGGTSQNNDKALEGNCRCPQERFWRRRVVRPWLVRPSVVRPWLVRPSVVRPSGSGATPAKRARRATGSGDTRYRSGGPTAGRRTESQGVAVAVFKRTNVVVSATAWTSPEKRIVPGVHSETCSRPRSA